MRASVLWSFRHRIPTGRLHGCRTKGAHRRLYVALRAKAVLPEPGIVVTNLSTAGSWTTLRRVGKPRIRAPVGEVKVPAHA